jgi:transposase
MQLKKAVQGPICKVWAKLKVEDNNGVYSSEVHQNLL